MRANAIKMVALSTLTSKEQLTLPQAVRRLLGVKAGDSLAWGLDEDGRVTVVAGRPHTLADVRAAIAAAGPRAPRLAPATIADLKAGIASEMKRKHAGR